MPEIYHRNMELRHLRCFTVVAQELHFGRAAERLYLTQPALTRQIQALETALQVQLFKRDRRKVELTVAGRSFLASVHQLLDNLEQEIQLTRKIAYQESRQIRVGATIPALYSLVPKILEHYQKTCSDVDVLLTGEGTETQVAALGNNELDVGFIHLPISDSNLCVDTLYQDSLLVALPVSHQLSRRKQIPLKLLARENLILHPRFMGSALYAQIEQLCQQSGFIPKIVGEAERMDTRLGLVMSGVGIALVLSNVSSG
jgi:DNA-binding transcriptional LysR family regulator